MKNQLNLILLFVLLLSIISCKKVNTTKIEMYDKEKNETNKSKEITDKLIQLYTTEGSLAILNHIPWEYNIELYEEDQKNKQNITLLGILTNQFGDIEGFAGMGFASCEITELFDEEEPLTFSLKIKYCINFLKDKNEEEVPDCLQFREIIATVEITSEDINYLINQRAETIKKKVDITDEYIVNQEELLE